MKNWKLKNGLRWWITWKIPAPIPNLWHLTCSACIIITINIIIIEYHYYWMLSLFDIQCLHVVHNYQNHSSKLKLGSACWACYWGYFCLSLNIFLRYFCLLFSTLLSIFLLVEHIIEYISSCYWACGQFPRQLSLLISIVLKSTRSENARVNNFNFYLHFFVLKNRKAIIINNLWKTYNYDNP